MKLDLNFIFLMAQAISVLAVLLFAVTAMVISALYLILVGHIVLGMLWGFVVFLGVMSILQHAN